MNSKTINIGLFGFGTVGKGLYDVLQKIKPENVNIVKVCVRNVPKHQAEAPELEFTDQADDIFSDPRVNFIVELIDDAEAAYAIVKRALQAQLPVVSGNKKMLARHINEMITLQRQHHTALLYDASACGSIPVIRNLEEYYDNDLLISVKGILNGSSNFILSKIFNEGMNYAQALELAQKFGFAESDPTLDIGGWDSLFKLIIICIHAFGVYVQPEEIFNFGIGNMNEHDIQFAHEKQRRIKLVGWAEKVDDDKVEAWIEVRVSPQKNEGFDAIAERITGYPEVRSVYLMSGGYDLMVRIEGNNLKNVAMFVARHLSTIDGVISTATHFLLKSYKRDGVVLVNKKGDKRQAVTL